MKLGITLLVVATLLGVAAIIGVRWSTSRKDRSLNWGLAVVALICLIFGLWFLMTSPSSTAEASQMSSSLTANFSKQEEGLKVTLNGNLSKSADGKEIDGYDWKFGDGATQSGETLDHTYAKPGTYTISLIVSSNGKESKPFTENVTLTAADTDTTPVVVPLEDPGPGNCLPGPAILKQLREQKPNGEDFQSPYSPSEILALGNAEINWISSNESVPCVQSLAGSYNVAPADLPGYIQNHLHLSEVGTGGLTVQNSFFAKTDGTIVWWKVQTFPQGELVWFDANGDPQMKFVCGNRLRKTAAGKPVAQPQPTAAPAPAKTLTPGSTPKPPKKTQPPTPTPCVQTPGVESCGKHAGFKPAPAAPVVTPLPGPGQVIDRGGKPTTAPTPAPAQTDPGRGDSGIGAINTTTAPTPAAPPPTAPATSAPTSVPVSP